MRSKKDKRQFQKTKQLGCKGVYTDTNKPAVINVMWKRIEYRVIFFAIMCGRKQLKATQGEFIIERARSIVLIAALILCTLLHFTLFRSKYKWRQLTSKQASKQTDKQTNQVEQTNNS